MCIRDRSSALIWDFIPVWILKSFFRILLVDFICNTALIASRSRKGLYSPWRIILLAFCYSVNRQSVIRPVSYTHLDVYKRQTYSLVDEEQIGRIGKYLNQAERVFVCGKGSSGLAASEMELRFMRIGVDIDSLQDSDRMRMQAVCLLYTSRCV